jgi:MFS family permease
MAQLDLFIVNIAIPAMARSFGGSSLSGLSWVLNGYAIVFAALLVPAGRLADHYGRRRFLLAGVLLFTAGSVVCAVAPTLAILVAGRVVQATGAAVIVPASLGLLLPAFPARQHSLVVGIWAGVAAVAASSGAPLGGLLVGASWRWIFLVNVPIGVVTIVAGRRVLPEIRAGRDARLPAAGAVLALLAAVTLLILGTVEGPSWGWSSAPVIGLLVAAGVAAAITVMQSLHSANPLLERSLFASREFSRRQSPCSCSSSRSRSSCWSRSSSSKTSGTTARCVRASRSPPARWWRRSSRSTAGGSRLAWVGRRRRRPVHWRSRPRPSTGWRRHRPTRLTSPGSCRA